MLVSIGCEICFLALLLFPLAQGLYLISTLWSGYVQTNCKARAGNCLITFKLLRRHSLTLPRSFFFLSFSLRRLLCGRLPPPACDVGQVYLLHRPILPLSRVPRYLLCIFFVSFMYMYKRFFRSQSRKEKKKRTTSLRATLLRF